MADKKYSPSEVMETYGRSRKQPLMAVGAIGGAWVNRLLKSAPQIVSPWEVMKTVDRNYFLWEETPRFGTHGRWRQMSDGAIGRVSARLGTSSVSRPNLPNHPRTAIFPTP